MSLPQLIVASIFVFGLVFAPSAFAAGPDLTFGSEKNGISNLRVGDNPFGANAVAVDQCGSIVAAGHQGNMAAIVKLTPRGDLDEAFGQKGVVKAGGVDGDNSSFGGVIIQPDGKLVAALQIMGDDGRSGLGLARFNPDGRGSDQAFKNEVNGMTAPGRAGGVQVETPSLITQADGKFVLAGHVDDALVVARFLPDGGADERFGGGIGFKTISSDGWRMKARAVAVQPDGKLVVVGSVTTPNMTAFLVIRLMPNGEVDMDFAKSGSLLVGSSRAEAVAIQPDGKILVAASYDVDRDGAHPSEIGVIRLKSDGSIDRSFTRDRFAGGEDGGGIKALGLSLKDDGKMVLTGHDRNGFVALHINPDGSSNPDKLSFVPFSAPLELSAIAFQGPDRAIAIGRNGQNLGAARYLL